MRLIKTFIERVTEKFTGVGWEVQPATETPFEKQFNDWAKVSGATVKQLVVHEDSDSGLMGDVRIRTFRCYALYDSEEVAFPSPVLPPPEAPRPWIPTVEVTLVESGGTRKMQAMAGACGVPQGYKLGADDTEPAPSPLFSPDVDLRKYATLFRSITNGSTDGSNRNI